MSFTEIIARKRDGEELSPTDIARFVQGATNGEVPAEQLAALLMAICIRGMSEVESSGLTQEMLNSGEQWNLAELRPEAVDKHSTGGIGDTVSLVFAPLLASLGIPVAMMAGRGLGHSQGTLDKLEAIPGFRVSWDREGMLSLIDSCGAAIIAQTAEIAPADRRLYALRDITGTVPSLPLIVASIMSKKLALGAGTLILDVKCGSGAFRKTLPEARELAIALRDVALRAGIKCQALITEMDQPLGPFLGTACEVREAIEVLSGRGSSRLRNLTLGLAEETMVLRGSKRQEAARQLEHALASGMALKAWEEMVRAHGGDPNPKSLPSATQVIEIRSNSHGFLTRVDGESLGWAAVEVGAGRRRLAEDIDEAAGLEICVEVGDRVEKGRTLARILLGRRELNLDNLQKKIREAFTLGEEMLPAPPLIYGPPDSIKPGNSRI